jgi:large subunit ribosomal protein L10
MNRTEKTEFIDTFTEKLTRAKLAVLTDYRGLDVNTLVEFRKKLTTGPATEFTVVKNTLFKRVIDGTQFEGLGEHLTGTNAVLLGYDDVVESAKALRDFAKSFEDKVVVKAGAMEGKALTADQVKALSDLPPKEVLQAMLLGVLNAPAQNLVSVLANANRQILNVLVAYRDKLEDQG